MERFVDCCSTNDSNRSFHRTSFSITGKEDEKEESEMRKRAEKAQLSSYDSLARISQENLENEFNNKEQITTQIIDEEEEEVEDLSNKFIIPGGWFGVVVVCTPITVICIFLCVVEGWVSLVISVILVAAMFLLKGIDIGITKLILCCKKMKVNKGTKVHNVVNFDDEAPNAL